MRRINQNSVRRYSRSHVELQERAKKEKTNFGSIISRYCIVEATRKDFTLLVYHHVDAVLPCLSSLARLKTLARTRLLENHYRGMTSRRRMTVQACLWMVSQQKQSYSPYPRAKWIKRWQEKKGNDLGTQIKTIIKELEHATVDIVRLVEEGERQAEMGR